MPFCESDIALVQATPLLQDIPEAVLREAIERNSEHQLALQPGQLFAEARLTSPGLFLIAHGIVELFISTDGKKEKTLDFIKSGGIIGEESVFTGQALSYSARSLTQAAAFFLPANTLSDWLDCYPNFAQRLMKAIASRIDYLYKDMLTLCTKRATARLVCYIVCHFERAPQTPDGSWSLHLPIPRAKLASRLNITASQFSRSLRELLDEGLIVEQGCGYFIPNVAMLSKYVCPKGCDI